MTVVISVENLSKKFSKRPELNKSRYYRQIFNTFFNVNQKSNLNTDEFWALNNVSFDIEKGQSIALIGRNGSGKSTLLKMLNGLTKPDQGRIIIDGNTQALINLGAGFDRNISGKENIINLIALAGVPRKNVSNKIQEIIEFSELEEFIDSPVSTYSSGMYARLGFSLATHVNTDIIFIDEILAVGDSNFQNKCFIKMQSLRNEGVTMLLVSHSEAQISQFCDKAIWLDKGLIKASGNCKDVLVKYNKFMDRLELDKERMKKDFVYVNNKEKPIIKKETKSTTTSVFGPFYPCDEKIKDVTFELYCDDKSKDVFEVNSSITLHYSFFLTNTVNDLNVSINICKEDGTLITTISTLNGDLLKEKSKGKVTGKVYIPDLVLTPGKYIIVMPVHEGHSYLFRDKVSEFRVVGREKLTWGLLTYDYQYHILG